MGEGAGFRTVFTGQVRGGPCPVCGLRGQLVAHHGTYGPAGVRTIVHRGEDGGDGGDGVYECVLPMADGRLWIGPDPVWEYKTEEKR